MTKKIKDLTKDEMIKLCATQECDTCPYRFFEVKISNSCTGKDSSYSICLPSIGKILEREVEIDDIIKR